jgi:hypothetical protein
MWLSSLFTYIMKTFKALASGALALAVMTLAIGCKSPDRPPTTTAGVKPYPLTKCVVSNEEIEPGKAYTFVRDGQEIKLCCKDCLADFDKDPKKYMAKINSGQ